MRGTIIATVALCILLATSHLPAAAGNAPLRAELTAIDVDAGRLTVVATAEDGTTSSHDVTVTDATRIRVGGKKKAALADLTVGAHLKLRVTVTDDGSTIAKSIQVVPAGGKAAQGSDKKGKKAKKDEKDQDDQADTAPEVSDAETWNDEPDAEDIEADQDDEDWSDDGDRAD